MNDELKYFILAKKLNSRFSLQLSEAHFRGNNRGLTLVSHSVIKPQLGIPILYDKNFTLERWNESMVEKHILKLHQKSDPGRPTPEKRVQSILIKAALNNNYILPFKNNKITYITDEIKIDKIADIIGVGEDSTLFIIELKSKRKKKELENQLLEFEKIVNQNTPFFKELILMVAGLNWNGKIEKMIVWPNASTSPLNLGTNTWTPKEIIEVCYKYNDGTLTLIEYDNSGAEIVSSF